jgi:hypothetical protein
MTTATRPALVAGTPTEPGFYHVRGLDVDIPSKVVLYYRTGCKMLWLHRPECRDSVDVPLLDAFSSWFWVKVEPYWIRNGPHAPPIQVGDLVAFPYYEAYASGYVSEKSFGWMKVYGRSPTAISPSHVAKFIPRNGVPVPVGASITILSELP